jgi:hypothetical protein
VLLTNVEEVYISLPFGRLRTILSSSSQYFQFNSSSVLDCLHSRRKLEIGLTLVALLGNH